MASSTVDDREIWRQVRALEGEPTSATSFAFGPYFGASVADDPMHLLFTLARYKFAARLLGSRADKDVLEVGCSEGWGTRILRSAARSVVALDFDADAIAWAESQGDIDATFLCRDFRRDHVGTFDAVVSIDVIEHVSQEFEAAFWSNLVRHLRPAGFAVIGTPNVTAKDHAGAASRLGHVHLYDAEELERVALSYFENVFLFGMNDEVLHTGFRPMCHYLFALCCRARPA